MKSTDRMLIMFDKSYFRYERLMRNMNFIFLASYIFFLVLMIVSDFYLFMFHFSPINILFVVCKTTEK